MATRANRLARKCPNVVSANDPEVIVKLRITLRQGKIKLARIRAFGHLENALAGFNVFFSETLASKASLN